MQDNKNTSQNNTSDMLQKPDDGSLTSGESVSANSVQQFGQNDKPRFSVQEIYGVSQNSHNQVPQGGGDNGSGNQDPSVSAKKTFVVEEPPVGSEPQQDPQNVLQPETLQPQMPPAPQAGFQPAQTEVAQKQDPAPTPPKKSPKFFVFVLIVLLLVLGLVYLIFKIINPSVTSTTDKGEVVWWGIQLEEADVEPLIKEYQDAHPNVKITYKKQSKIDYRERLTNSLAQNTGPDIFEMHNTWPAMFVNELSILPAEVMSADEFSKTFYPVIFSDLNTSKGIVGIPLEFDALTLFINEDIFTSAVRTPPNTWDELKNLASEFTQRDGSGQIIQSGVAMGFTNNVDHWPEILGLMIMQNGASPAFPSQPRAEDSVNYYKLFSQNRIWDESQPTSTSAFARGKLAMYFGPSKRALDITIENPNLKFRTTTLPQLPKDKPSDPSYSYATYWVEGVWQRSQSKTAAWEFLKFLSSSSSIEKVNLALKQRSNLERISPRVDMAQIWTKDPVLGSVTNLATQAKSWYLASDTYDGETGLNTQVNSVYKKVISGDAGLNPSTTEIAGILEKYGLPVK